MATNNSITQNDFAERVKALGINLAQLAKISGYSKGGIYSISKGRTKKTNIIFGYIKLLEILQRYGYLQNILDEYSIKVKGSTMAVSPDNGKNQEIQNLKDLLEQADKILANLAELEPALSAVRGDIQETLHNKDNDKDD